MIWYLDDPLRYRSEREGIDALANASPWLVPGGWRVDGSMRVLFDAQIVTPHQIYPITVRYPSHFPFSPPLVLPPKNSARWSSHQYGNDGELCLELGPDNWQPHFTGANQIASAYRLLMSEGPSAGNAAEVPSRHELTMGQELRGEVFRMMITEGMRIAAGDLPDAGWLSLDFVSLYQKGCLVYFPVAINDRNGHSIEDQSVPEPVRVEERKRPAVLVRWPQQVVLPPTDSVANLKDAIAALGFDISAVVVLVLVQGANFSAVYLHDDGTTSSFTPIHLNAAHRRLDTQYDVLASKKVGLVGCGSMGSKIATALARSGVGHFLIVDDDIFLPENLVRHDLDWREIGTHKASSVARRLKLVSPTVECKIRLHRLGGQESSGSIETLISGLSECDLIIDATANPAAFNYLSAAAIHGKTALLWAEIFGGGYGGLIARHRPAFDPEPMAMRSAIENWCADQGTTYPSTGGYDLEGPAPMLASDADLGAIAAHAARFAEDTLVGSAPSAFPHSVYLIGLRREWVFTAPFHTQPIDVGSPPPSINSPDLDPAIVEAEKAQIRSLFEKFIDENTPSAEPPATPSG